MKNRACEVKSGDFFLISTFLSVNGYYYSLLIVYYSLVF